MPILEQKLRELAPFVKYVPNREKFDSLTTNWRETAGAWFELKCIEKGNFEYVRSELEFRFYKKFIPLPETGKDSLAALYTREAKERDQLAQTVFFEALPKSFAEARNLPGVSQLLIKNITLAIQDEFLGLADPSAKIGRNEPCPCGSGKKHKKCCL